MNWKDVGASMAQNGLPALGRLLYGPLGGSIGDALGKVIAESLGSDPTPEAIHEAISADPEAAVEKLKTLEAAKQAELDAAAKSLSAVNETMRTEVASPQGDRFTRWARPANMWAVASVTGGYGIAMVFSAFALVITKDVLALSKLVELAPALGIALAPAGAVAGVAAWGRTKEKLAGVSDGGSTTMIAGAAAKITKKT